MADASSLMGFRPLVATGMGRRAAERAGNLGRVAGMQLADAETGIPPSIFSDLEEVMANAGREDVFGFVFRNREMLAQEALKNPAKAAMLNGILGSKAYQIFESGVLQSMNEADSSAAETPSRSGGIPSLVAPINQSGY